MSFTEVMDSFGRATYGENYESRPEQAGLGEAITKAFGDNENLFAEAPTGTGKSYGAAIPAGEWARENNSRVVIATATKALQDQYAADLPLLADHMGLKLAVLKGRGNYVCRAKVPGVIDQFPGLGEELEIEGQTGDFDTLITPLPPQAKSLLTTSSEECPGKNECPFGDVCFAQQAKTRAEDAHIIVVNHSVLVIDRLMRSSEAALIPDYGRVIVDEAHNLEDYATSALGKEISQRSAKDVADQAMNLFTDVRGKDADDSYVKKVNSANDALFDKIDAKLRQARETSLAVDDVMLLEFEDELVNLVHALYQLHEQIKFINTEVARDDVIARRKRLLKRSRSALGAFTSLMPAEETTDPDEIADDEQSPEDAEGAMKGAPFTPIRWIQTEERTQRGGGTVKRTTLNYAPLEVGPLLRQIIWDVPGTSAVLMSATLSVNGDFSYLANRLGLREFRTFIAESPFDYDNQSAIYVPHGADPSKDANGWRFTLNIQLVEMAKAAGGRALFLFTSRKSMRDTYEAIGDKLRDAGLKVLMQGDGMPNPMIVAEKKADPSVVVFALKSFMEGVNIPGDALQLVVIDKLPFPAPNNIIFKARSEAINARYRDDWASFSRLSIPMMSLVLQQAVGRLIRTKSDRGLVVVMDGRMNPKPGGCRKPYTQKLFNSVESGPLVDTLDEATSYLAGLRSA